MKIFFFKTILFLLKFYNPFYFKKVRVYGQENIPKDGSLIFSPNHQGSFLDPILVATTCGFEFHSLTRSDVFGGRLQWFLDALKMLPVYRIRDGYSSLKKNKSVFEKCHELLAQGKNLIMFSEGLHHNEYFLKRISKGSSRLALEAQIKNANKNIYLIPVGINYSHHNRTRQEVHIVYGTPIPIRDLTSPYKNEPSVTINELRERLEINMKDCLWIEEEDENYFEKKKFINHKNAKLGFYKLKEIVNSKPNSLNQLPEPTILKRTLIFFFSLPNTIPLLVISRILNLFPDKVFHNGVKHLIGLIIFVLWWIILFFSLIYFVDIHLSSLIIFGFIVSLFLRQELLSSYK
jgi:1-acyl-sn-glycerol-3-phosphate acyltransferase